MNHEKVVLLLNYATVKVINCCVWLEVCYFAGKRNCVLTFILRPPGKIISLLVAGMPYFVTSHSAYSDISTSISQLENKLHESVVLITKESIKQTVAYHNDFKQHESVVFDHYVITPQVVE